MVERRSSAGCGWKLRSLRQPHSDAWAHTVGFLSATLQRQNFQVLAGCAPFLAGQIGGCLGRPLSEAPEFWRAAPEAALARGTHEFDLPPPLPSGTTDEQAPEAVGLLRASGMRL